MGTDHLVNPAIVGVVRALKRARLSPQDAFRGVGYGIMQGAIETGSDLSKAATHAVAATREAAKTLGLENEEEAVRHVAEGALAAIEEIAPEALAQVRAALPPELTEVHHPRREQQDNRSE